MGVLKVMKVMTAPEPLAAPNVISLLRVSSDRQDVARQRGDMQLLQRRFGVTIARTLHLQGVSGTAVLDNKQIQQILRDLLTA